MQSHNYITEYIGVSGKSLNYIHNYTAQQTEPSLDSRQRL